MLPEGAGAFRPLDTAAQFGPLGPGFARLSLHVERHGIQRAMGGGAEGIRIRRLRKPPANGVLLDIAHTAYELLFAHDLALVEAAHPHVELALQAEGESALDELHRFFKRNIRSRRDQRVEMVGHDDEGVQEKSPLTAIVEDGLFKQFRRGRDLEKAAALRRDSGDQIRSSFLWGQAHVSRINERPVAKAIFISDLSSGA